MEISKSSPEKKASKRVFQTQYISNDERHHMIAEAAYFRAAQRGFEGGDPVSDWLAAEAEINERLAKRDPAYSRQGLKRIGETDHA